MKHLAAVLALPLAALSTSAWAQEGASNSDTAQVPVTGTVAALCILGDANPASVALGQMIATSGAGVGRIATLPSQAVTLPQSFCNFAGSKVTVTADALVATSGGTPPASFAKAVNYTATASGWASPNAVATSNAAADGSNPTSTPGDSGTQSAPKLSDITVTLSNFTVPGNALLIAGDYNGTVTVTLGPVAIQGDSAL